MKRFSRILKIVALVLAVCACSAIFFSCDSETYLKSVELKVEEGTPTEYIVGEFSYDGYSILRRYSDGSTETIPLTEDLVAPAERLKLLQPGTQTVAFEYEGQQLSFTCRLVRDNFDDIELVPLVATYDGQPHEVQFSGEVPAGTIVTINNGNSLSFTEAGTYVASVTLNKEGYAPKDLACDVVINKADYDVSTFTFEDEYFEYDKKPHALEIKGKLPQGVTARYMINNERGNSAVNIGDYRVTVDFTYTNSKNYNPLNPITKTLHIVKRSVGIKQVEADFKNLIEKNLFSYNGQSKVTAIKNALTLPKEVNSDTVKYTFYKKNDGSFEEVNDVIQSGDYKVLVVLGVRPEYMAECTLDQTVIDVDFTVLKATFSASQFVDWTTIFTGEPQSLEFTGIIPAYYNHDPIYYIKPFGAPDSDYVEGNSATSVGKYTVKVEFPSDENFMRIPVRTATLTINKYYYDLPMPEDIDEQYDGTVYTLQEVVDKVNRDVTKTANVIGVGVDGRNITCSDVEGEYVPLDNAELNVTLEMFNEKGERIEQTDGVGVYTIKGSYTAADYEMVEKITVYTIRQKVTDFTRPADATRIYYDGRNHADFFNLEIPTYVINGGVDFYTMEIYETDQEGNFEKRVTEVKNAGYYSCVYHLEDDHNFIYEHDFEVREFEIRRIEITSEFLAGLQFTTTVASGGFIIDEAQNSVAAEYPLLQFGRDYDLEVLNMDFEPVASIPADTTSDYYIRLTIKDLVNYVAYDGVNEVNTLAEIFKIIDPKALDDVEFIKSGTVYYTDNTNNVKQTVNEIVLGIVGGYQELSTKYILYFNADGTEVPDGALKTVGKYYAIIYFNDSLYYTLDGDYKNMHKRIDFEIRTKTIIKEGDFGKYEYNTADEKRGKDFIAMTDKFYEENYKSKGLVVQSRTLYQENSDGSETRITNLDKALTGGNYYIQYSFTDNLDFIIGGKSINMLYNIPVNIKQLYEVKSSDFDFSVTTQGSRDSVLPDIRNTLKGILSDRFSDQLMVKEDELGNQLFFLWYPDGSPYDEQYDLIEVGKFKARISFVGGANGIFFKRLSNGSYTLTDLTFDFTITVESFGTEIGTQYFKATGDDNDNYDAIVAAIRKAAEKNVVKEGDDLNEIATVKITQGGNVKTEMKSRNFGYYDYEVTYTNKYYASSKGRLVFAPYRKVYIEANVHDGYAIYASEWLIKGTFDNRWPNIYLKDLHFVGRAEQISDYFADEWEKRIVRDCGVSYYIRGYQIRLNVSDARLQEYNNWQYAFFTFGPNLTAALLNPNVDTFRVELFETSKPYYWHEDSHNTQALYNGEKISL